MRRPARWQRGARLIQRLTTGPRASLREATLLSAGFVFGDFLLPDDGDGSEDFPASVPVSGVRFSDVCGGTAAADCCFFVSASRAAAR